MLSSARTRRSNGIVLEPTLAKSSRPEDGADVDRAAHSPREFRPLHVDAARERTDKATRERRAIDSGHRLDVEDVDAAKTGHDSERDAHGRARRDDELRLQADDEPPRKCEVADEVDHAPRRRPEPVVDAFAFEQGAGITAVVRDPSAAIAIPRGPKGEELYEVASGVTDEEDIGILLGRRSAAGVDLP